MNISFFKNVEIFTYSTEPSVRPKLFKESLKVVFKGLIIIYNVVQGQDFQYFSLAKMRDTSEF